MTVSNQLERYESDGSVIWYRQGTVDEIVLADAYQQTRFTLPELESGHPKVILDVGAHIGCFSIMAAKRLTNSVVYALEPARSTFELLATNVEANGLINIIPMQIALAGENGTLTLHHAAENWGHSIHPDLAGSTGATEAITAKTIEQFIADAAITTVDHMKMNIEGAEYDVLLGAGAETLSRIRRIELEFHPFAAADGRQLATKLSQCGFDVDTTWSQQEKGKGWIHASRD